MVTASFASCQVRYTLIRARYLFSMYTFRNHRCESTFWWRFRWWRDELVATSPDAVQFNFKLLS